jgi:hypothetical protein
LIGLVLDKKTHLPRGTAARIAELKGVLEDQIVRAGRWIKEQMIGCYLTCLPLVFMRRMAGHPSQRGGFEIKRAAIIPPDELLSIIWPDLDNWGPDRFGPNKIDDLAADGFCTLLRHLRTVILQDSVPLREAFPEHPIWNHRIFHQQAYTAFAAQVKESGYLQQDGSISYTSRLVQTVPEIVDNLQTLANQMTNQSISQRQENAKFDEKFNSIKIVIEKTQETLQYLASGGLVFQLKMAAPAPAPTPAGPAEPAPAGPIPPVPAGGPAEPAEPAAPAAAPAGLAAAMLTVPIVPVSPLPPPPPLSPPSSLSPPPSSPPQYPPPQQYQLPIAASLPAPQYKMSRDVRTVEMLYREWTEGLQGALSIRELDRRYSHHWRKGRSAELQFYSIRKEIMREIERIRVTDGVNEVTAARRVQGRQDREMLSLDKLGKRLREEAKAREARRRDRALAVAAGLSGAARRDP